ncbi:hypothetical protein BDV98DRAFT_598092 [Pterulicium gracile]|uniref:Uncharacterized protein n=1 Tax=Pterulicium gracile TaxID=1884261 RepID=A0A5C3QC04_9AGAR|nr:hypothetical protein BDV98DRAFT_598092 [Pterula gracilis]
MTNLQPGTLVGISAVIVAALLALMDAWQWHVRSNNLVTSTAVQYSIVVQNSIAVQNLMIAGV